MYLGPPELVDRGPHLLVLAEVRLEVSGGVEALERARLWAQGPLAKPTLPLLNGEALVFRFPLLAEMAPE
eukprot:13416979-Alexandrium_andersonii.AAC.1